MDDGLSAYDVFGTTGWLAVASYILFSLLRPLPPFRTRLQALGIGLPALLAGALMLGVSAGTEGSAAAADEGTRTIEGSTPPTEQPKKGAPGRIDLDVVSLTHMHNTLGKRVTYSKPVVKRVLRSEVPVDVWTISDDFTDIVCFEDGNNAVIFTIKGDLFAANGKARQFVRFDEGDGLMFSDGVLRPVLELPPGEHLKMAGYATKLGLDMCGRRPLEEIATAVSGAAAVKPASAATPEEAYLNVAVAMRGAEICGYEINFPAIADYLHANGIGKDDFMSQIAPYAAFADAVLDDGEKSFCTQRLLPKFGPAGFGFVSQ